MDDEESEDEDFVDDGSGPSGGDDDDDEEGEDEQSEGEPMIDEDVDKEELKALKRNEKTTGKRKRPGKDR